MEKSDLASNSICVNHLHPRLIKQMPWTNSQPPITRCSKLPKMFQAPQSQDVPSSPRCSKLPNHKMFQALVPPNSSSFSIGGTID
ncbi:hypothetical protein SUGI_1160630 [Cryptomeria japonica]|nr:hypothetical protein SUGI_1160630 [Cryptomeria japonica]